MTGARRPRPQDEVGALVDSGQTNNTPRPCGVGLLLVLTTTALTKMATVLVNRSAGSSVNP